VPYPSWKDNEKLQQEIQEIGIRENFLREVVDLSDWRWIENAGEIVRGFLNATDFSYGGNKTNCSDSLVIIWGTLGHSL